MSITQKSAPAKAHEEVKGGQASAAAAGSSKLPLNDPIEMDEMFNDPENMTAITVLEHEIKVCKAL